MLAEQTSAETFALPYITWYVRVRGIRWPAVDNHMPRAYKLPSSPLTGVNGFLFSKQMSRYLSHSLSLSHFCNTVGDKR